MSAAGTGADDRAPMTPAAAASAPAVRRPQWSPVPGDRSPTLLRRGSCLSDLAPCHAASSANRGPDMVPGRAWELSGRSGRLRQGDVPVRRGAARYSGTSCGRVGATYPGQRGVRTRGARFNGSEEGLTDEKDAACWADGRRRDGGGRARRRRRGTPPDRVNLVTGVATCEQLAAAATDIGVGCAPVGPSRRARVRWSRWRPWRPLWSCSCRQDRRRRTRPASRPRRTTEPGSPRSCPNCPVYGRVMLPTAHAWNCATTPAG